MEVVENKGANLQGDREADWWLRIVREGGGQDPGKAGMSRHLNRDAKDAQKTHTVANLYSSRLR